MHPVLFATFPVLFLFSQNLNELKIQDVIIPLLLIIALSFVIWLSIGYVIKNYRKAGFVTSIGVMIFFTYGHFYLPLAGKEFAGIIIANNIVFPFFGVFLICAAYFIKTKRTLDNATKITNGIGFALLVVVFVNISTFYLENPEFEKEEIYLQNNSSSNFSYTPDVYYLIFDEYPRTDTLQEIFDYDNHEMINFLNNNGFYIAHDSHSNYPQTSLSLSSSLNMKQINYLQNELGKDSINNHPIFQLFDNNIVMQKFKIYGYKTIGFDNGWGSDRLLSVADLTLCRSDLNLNSEFLIMLMRTSILNPVYVKLFDSDYREKVLCAFSELENIPKRYDEPVFVFAHIFLPHHPYVFGPNGEEIIPDSMSLKDEYTGSKVGFLNQVKFADQKIVEVTEKILRKSEVPPIIIIQSDHGSQVEVDWNNPSKKDLRQRLSILNAYHLPNGGSDLLYPSITPVNSFRVIFNYYFNETTPLLEDQIFFSQYDSPYNFTDVTEILATNYE